MVENLNEISPLSVEEGVERVAAILERGHRLQRAILLFIVYRSEITRSEGDSSLTQQLEAIGLNITRVDFSIVENTDWVAQIFHAPPKREEVFFLYDIGAAGSNLLKSLNYRREILSEQKVLAVFWVNEQELQSIAEFAPDFFRFRTEILELLTVPPLRQVPEIVRGIIHTTASSRETFKTAQEVEDRITLRKHLLVSLKDDPSAKTLCAELKKNLADLYQSLYMFRGSLAHLDKSIQLYHEALTVISKGLLQTAGLNDLGGAYLRRYWHAGNPDDLDKAIQLWERLIASTPSDSAQLPGYLSNLGAGFLARYSHTHTPKDLEQAIEVLEKAVTVMPPQFLDQAAVLNNLGNSFKARYHQTGALADLNQSLLLYEEALQAILDDSIDQAALLTNLGLSLYARYERTGALADLKRAIAMHEEAIAVTPDGSPYLPWYRKHLHLSHQTWGKQSENLQDWGEA